MDDPTCPCEDGLPDPCTLCGEPADGVCQLNTLNGWKHRAEVAEAERDAAVARADEFVEVDYWCHFDDKGRAVRVHDTSTVHMDGCVRMYVRGTDRRRDDDRHPLTRSVKARETEWGTDR